MRIMCGLHILMNLKQNEKKKLTVIVFVYMFRLLFFFDYYALIDAFSILVYVIETLLQFIGT